MAVVNFHAVAALIVLLLQRRRREDLHKMFDLCLKQWILKREEQGVFQNPQRKLVLVEASSSFSAVTILFTRCVKETGKSFHIATSASSFLGVQRTPTMLVAIFPN